LGRLNPPKKERVRASESERAKSLRQFARVLV
jgi:hypothetical protein